MKAVTGLQKLIEEIVEGLIVFIYNTLKTFVRLWFRPLKNAARLNALSSIRKGQQISSSTALFVSSALAVSGPIFTLETAYQRILQIYGATWYEWSLAVLAVYVFLDITAMLIGVLVSSKRRQARSIHLVRYGIAASTCLFWLMSGLVLIKWGNAYASSSAIFPDAIFYILLLMVPTAYPLFIISGHLLRQRVNGSAIVLGAFALLSAPIVFGVQIAAIAIGFIIVGQIQALTVKPRPATIEVKDAACVVASDGSVAVTAFIDNNLASPVFLAHDQFDAIIGSFTKDLTEYFTPLTVIADQSGSPLLPVAIGASSSATVKYSGRINVATLEWPLAKIDYCRLRDVEARRVEHYGGGFGLGEKDIISFAEFRFLGSR